MNETQNTYDYVGAIIDFEAGELSQGYILELFAYLIKTGMIYHLQGMYHRTAHKLIEDGLISAAGERLDKQEIEYNE